MRWLKFLFTVIALLVVVAIGGAFTLRYMQGTFDPPRDIAGADGVAAIANMGAEIYAVKVGDRDAILIDTGIDPAGGAVERVRRELGTSRRITHAFITHGHLDHVGAINELQHDGAIVHAGAADADWIALTKTIDKLPMRLMVKVLKTSPSKPDDLLEGRKDIDVGGETVTAIPLPGHTLGTYLYFHRHVLYTGDAILYDEKGKLNSGVDFFNEDTKQNRASIAALDLTGLDVKTICTGHTGCTTGDANAMLAALIADCVKNP